VALLASSGGHGTETGLAVGVSGRSSRLSGYLLYINTTVLKGAFIFAARVKKLLRLIRNRIKICTVGFYDDLMV